MFMYFGDLERQLLSLPSRLRDPGILNPAASCTAQFDSSLKVTSSLVSLLMEQTAEFTVIAINEKRALKQEVYLNNRHRCEEMAATLRCEMSFILAYPLLSLDLQQARESASLKGASSWLTVLPIDEHGFSQHKSVF